MQRSSTRPQGFTLVELLVVIAIIATLAALLLPAISRAREMGRRTACTSNLYQIAIGMSRYNDSVGYLPGWRNMLTTATGTSYPSWPVMILPQIDRNDVYKIWLSGISATPPAIATFICPSAAPDNPANPALAYAGICAAINKNDGIMTDRPQTASANRVALDDISAADGTGTTLLIAEKAGFGSRYTQGPWNTVWPANSLSNFDLSTGSTPQIPGITVATNSRAVPPINSFVNNVNEIGTTGDYFQFYLPSSMHVGGFVAVFADGHTVFVKDTVAPHVFAQAMTPKTTWTVSGTSSTNSPGMNAWLTSWPSTTTQPYLFSEADLQ